MQYKVILDVDTGEDDALALILAIKKNLPLKAIITSFGNTSLDNSTRNSADIMHLINANIEIIEGSEKPLQPHPFETGTNVAGDFVGKNGLCNVTLPPNKSVSITKTDDQTFEKYISFLLAQEEKVDYIVTGPCTNLARICKYFGNTVGDHINKVYIMGGAVTTEGNSGPKDPKTGGQLAEFNFYCDPHAVNIVLESGLDITVVPWDLTSTCTVPFSDISSFKSKTPEGLFIIDLMQSFFKYYGLSNDRNFELNDPITLYAYENKGKTSKMKIKVLTDKDHYGQSVKDSSGYEINYFTLKDRKKIIDELLYELTITA